MANACYRITYKEVLFLEARQLAVKFADIVEVAKEVVHVVERVDDLIKIAHHFGGMLC